MTLNMMLKKLTLVVLLTLISGVLAGVNGCSSSDSGASKSPTGETVSSSPSPISTDKATSENKKSEATLSVENSIASELFLPKGINVSSIACPNDLQVKADSTFDCQANSAQGPFKVGVTVKNDKGDMSFKTKGLLLLPAMEKVIPEGIKQQTGADVTVDCGSKKSNIRTFKTVGESFQCDLLKDGNKDGVVKVTITGESGEINWAL